MTRRTVRRAPLWPRRVGPRLILALRGTPAACVGVLQTAARPNQHRLHLRDAFAEGRRYDVRATPNGFWMTTNDRSAWRYIERQADRRTARVADLFGTLEPLADNLTRLEAVGVMRWTYWLAALPVPLFMLSIVWFVPWPPPLTVAVVAALFVLAFLYRYAHATSETAYMLYFLQKALEEHIVAQPEALPAKTPDVVQDAFPEAWAAFYEAHKDE